MVEKRTVCVRQLGTTRAGEKRFGRLLANPCVTTAEMLDTVARLTDQAAAGRHVLVIQDTTELNYEAHARRTRGLGTVGNGTDHGFFLHPLLVMQEDTILGLAGATLWQRHDTGRAHRRSRSIQDKESQRWIAGLEHAQAALPSAARITVITDSEGDIYELFAAPRQARTDLLVRLAQDRRTAQGIGLFAYARALPLAQCFALDLRAEPGRAARRASLELRFGTVTICRPGHGGRHLPESVTLGLVEVFEPAPPEGVKGVLWRLVSSHMVADTATALWVVGLYGRRWMVEQLFRTIKRQGFDLEQSQLESAAGLEKMAVLALIAGVRTLQLVQARDGGPHPARHSFTAEEIEVLERLGPRLEGPTLKQRNPHAPGSLSWAAWIIARLGGWKGYARERPPGPITFLHGLHRFYAMAEGFHLARLVGVP